MSEAVQAIDVIFLFRIQGETGSAWKLGLQTDNSTEESRSYETTPTKDGSTKTAGAYEGSHSITSFMTKGDVDIRKLKQLIRDKNPAKLEVWEIDRSNINDATELDGDYSIDSVTSIGTSAGAEGSVEVSIETEVNNTIVSGKVQVTPELLAILRTIDEDQAFVQPMVAEVPPVTG